MKKMNLFLARTALVMLPISIIAIIVLAKTPWGMNEFLWQVSWDVLTLSICGLYLLIGSSPKQEYDHSTPHERH